MAVTVRIPSYLAEFAQGPDRTHAGHHQPERPQLLADYGDSIRRCVTVWWMNKAKYASTSTSLLARMQFATPAAWILPYPQMTRS